MPVRFKDMIHPAKNIWQYSLAIFVLSTLSVPFLYNGDWRNITQLGLVLIWSFTIWITQFFGHTFIIMSLDDKISWTKRPLIRGILGILFMAVYASAAFILAQMFLRMIIFQEMPTGSLIDWIRDSWFAVKIAFAISFFITFLGFINAMRKSEIEKEKLKTQMMVHKYNALQSQINPHFLFNSFNVLSELVYEDQKLAVKFIRQLSDLYRYVLKSKNEDLVPLADEMDFLHSFSFLLKTRFMDQLDFQIEIKAEQDEYIVPMTLQLLVENAVKHNEASTKNPLIIQLYRKDDRLIVENQLIPKAQTIESTKKGLKIIQERYEYLDQGKVEVIKEESAYRVSIPIIKMNN